VHWIYNTVQGHSRSHGCNLQTTANTFQNYWRKPQAIYIYIVWCVMSFLPFLLPKLILLAFWLSWGSNKTEILGFNFSRPSTPFYVTIFKMAVSKLNMPHIDPSKLHTITNFVSEPMFLIMKNVLVYVRVILEWQPSWKSNMAARKCDREFFWTRVNNLVKFRFISLVIFIYILTYWLF